MKKHNAFTVAVAAIAFAFIFACGGEEPKEPVDNDQNDEEVIVDNEESDDATDNEESDDIVDSEEPDDLVDEEPTDGEAIDNCTVTKELNLNTTWICTIFRDGDTFDGGEMVLSLSNREGTDECESDFPRPNNNWSAWGKTWGKGDLPYSNPELGDGSNTSLSWNKEDHSEISFKKIRTQIDFEAICTRK